MIIETNGEKCSCGKRGCFESCCSAAALIRYARERIKDHPDSLLLAYASGNQDAITGEMISKAWDEEDAAAKQAVEIFAKKLSIGMVNLINLFNPEIIIISGGVSQLGERILGRAREQVENTLMHPIQHCRIVTGELGIDAGVMGACYLARSNT
jgi:glucokinase